MTGQSLSLLISDGLGNRHLLNFDAAEHDIHGLVGKRFAGIGTVVAIDPVRTDRRQIPAGDTKVLQETHAIDIGEVEASRTDSAEPVSRAAQPRKHQFLAFEDLELSNEGFRIGLGAEMTAGHELEM